MYIGTYLPRYPRYSYYIRAVSFSIFCPVPSLRVLAHRNVSSIRPASMCPDMCPPFLIRTDVGVGQSFATLGLRPHLFSLSNASSQPHMSSRKS